MQGNEKFDKIIREKLGHIQENPPDFVWDNISQSNVNAHANNPINQTDQAIRNKLNELTKEPPVYVWTHVQYYLELLTIWQNIKRVLLWRRVKRTLKTLLMAITMFLLIEYPLNNYELLHRKPVLTAYVTDIGNKSKSAKSTYNTDFGNDALQSPSPSSFNHSSVSQSLEHSLANEGDSYQNATSQDYLVTPFESSSSTTGHLISEERGEGSQASMFTLPQLKIQLEASSPQAGLNDMNLHPDHPEESATIHIWQVDIGSQFSIMVSEYLIQSLFSSQFVTFDPGFMTSFYLGRIIPAKSHIYRIGVVYGGFDSKIAVLIDGRWRKETVESRYLGVSGSVGKPLLYVGYNRWIDGWLNTSVIYFLYHIYSSEILRVNPSSNNLGILISGELNYAIGLKNGDMLLIGGRINALPVSIFKQKGNGKFVNLELHLGMRL
ncbi:MAG: hypothetical protein GXO48_02215 [Chlorobi bacterium]|nr:hypothetical protein [Chlorobiota bacterium]